jgi:hypothetical protein
MSDQTIRFLVCGALLLHGLGHGGALGALIWIERKPGTDTGGWKPARSWLFPSLPARVALAAAGIFWLLSAIGFIAASASFWGVIVPADMWRQLAVASAIVSTLGMVLFLGIWPAFNALASFAVNITVLVTQFWLHWPSRDLFGN